MKGNHLAQMEMQLILTLALQKYILQLVPNHPVVMKPVVSLTPKYGMRMVMVWKIQYRSFLGF